MRYLIALVMCIAAFSADAGTRKPKKAPVESFSAKSYLVADESGNVLNEKDGTIIRSIASISKLMIGLLSSEQDLDEYLTVPKTRSVQSSIPRTVETLKRRELLALALVKSDNFAAQILCQNVENCVDNMNARARSIGMEDTHFLEPTGLDYGNVSTARDLLKLLLVVSGVDVIAHTSSLSEVEIHTSKKSIKVKNTNPLTSKFSIVLSKTGFTNAAGGCLVMIMQTSIGKKIFILLGSKNTKTRIPDMERLIKDNG